MIQDIAPHKYYVDYQPSVPNDTDLVLIYGHHTILCNFEDPEIRYPSIAEIAAVFPEIKEKVNFCSALMRRTITNCAVRSFRNLASGNTKIH